MKNIILALVLTLLALPVAAQLEFPPPPPMPGDIEVIYCRGTQEVDENGEPVPDDPNCVPDPSTGGTDGADGGTLELIIGWFRL